MVSGPKHYWNLNDSAFTIFADRCERNSGWKCLPELYANSSDCLLTHWVPIISILLLTEAIYCNILRCNYLNFLFNFLNLDSILNIKKKRWTSELMDFWTDGLPKTWLDKCLNSPVSEDPSRNHMVNGPKHCWNHNDSTFTIFIDPCERDSVAKSLC